jgi:hypothetical protein
LCVQSFGKAEGGSGGFLSKVQLPKIKTSKRWGTTVTSWPKRPALPDNVVRIRAAFDPCSAGMQAGMDGEAGGRGRGYLGCAADEKGVPSPHGQTADVEGVEAVHILFQADGIQDLTLVDVLG